MTAVLDAMNENAVILPCLELRTSNGLNDVTSSYAAGGFNLCMSSSRMIAFS
jgi:hypothetical protein